MDVITHTKGTESPALQNTISVDGAPFDLTGSSVRFRMRELSVPNPTLKVDAPAAIVNPPGVDGVVRYEWQAADVDTATAYLAWFQVTLPDASTQDTPEFLVVIVEHEPADRSLCELADVLRYVPGYESEPATDTTLQTLIVAESRQIHQETAREIVAIAGADPRLYELRPRHLRTRAVWIDDCTQVTTVRLLERDGTTLLETVAASGYHELPRVREEWEPIRRLAFLSPAYGGSASLQPGRFLEVSGTWGFPSIPENLRQACAKRVINRYMTDVAASGTSFADAVNESDLNLALLRASANEAIAGYRDPSFA